MIIGKFKSEIQSNFFGGTSIDVDWYSIAERAGRILRQKINPKNLKRRTPIFAGLNGATDIYYCPVDVKVPTTIYNNSTREKWEYQPSRFFHENNSDSYKFTIETINGVRFLLVRHSESAGSLEIDSFDEVGSKTGVSLSLNSFNYISGVGALQGTFTDSITTVAEVLATEIDVTDYKRGVVLAPMNFENENIISSIEIQLLTDSSNYYSMTSTTDSVGDNFIRGWNVVRFDFANATATGSPTDTNITEYKVIATMETGESQTIIIDRLSLEKTAFYQIEYYSDYMFLDATDNSWKAEADDDSDIINIEQDAQDALIYEACLLVALGNYENKEKGKMDFTGELLQAYSLYNERNPSDEMPVSYNSSDLDNLSRTLNLGYDN